VTESYTQSPPPKHTPLRRAGTVADRISEKLRAASVHQRRASADTSRESSPIKPTAIAIKRIPDDKNEQLNSPSSPKEDAFIPPEDPNGFPTIHGEAPPVPAKDSHGAAPEAPATPVSIAGLSLSPNDFNTLLVHFNRHLQTHPALGSALQGELSGAAIVASRQRSTILGTYEHTFSGAEVIQWLTKNIRGFGEWDRAVEAATDLQRLGHISRIGVGRGFEPTDDTFYTLKLHPGDGTALAAIQSSFKDISKDMSIASPLSTYSSSINKYLPASLNVASDEPPHVRLRREANVAQEDYRFGVNEAEVRRLEMEEKIEQVLRTLEKWERERLGVISSVLKHYERVIGKLPKRLESFQESTELSVEAFNPDADLKALIEGSRTGPFRPRPHIYEPLASDSSDVNFGIDLRRWSGETAWTQMVASPERARPKDAVPEVLTALLQAFTEMGADLEPAERRKTWIYEVPLVETHALRSNINSAQLTIDDMVTIAKRFNTPIIAATTKLWLLELNPPVLGWEGWEDAKAIYPSVGADQERDMTSAVVSVLDRLPASQLFSLNTIVKFWKE
jgi:hypothetical protein